MPAFSHLTRPRQATLKEALNARTLAGTIVELIPVLQPDGKLTILNIWRTGFQILGHPEWGTRAAIRPQDGEEEINVWLGGLTYL